MNITKQNIDELNAVLKLQVNKADYEQRVANVLNDYRKKARIDGFRPGKVPLSLISKLYGKSVLVEEINKLISESITDYLKNEQLNILGDPLPNKEVKKPIDWDNDTEFEFAFDLGLSPQFDIKLSDKEKFPFYQVKVDESMIDNYVNTYTRRYGRFIDAQQVEENELLKGDLQQIDATGNITESGIQSNDVSLFLELAKDEVEKKAFINAKTGDSIDFDIKKAFPNDFELSNLLKIDKDKIAEVEGKFRFTIKSISKFEKAELNQELFNKIYGEGKVTSEEEFMGKIEEEIKNSLVKESDYKFMLDIKEHFIKKTDMKLPSDFLKRWLEFANEGKLTVEQIEKEFPVFEDDMKWQIIKDKIVKGNNIEVKKEEIVEYARMVTRQQFQQYGMYNVPDEQIISYAEGLLKKESETHKIIEKVLEKKVIEFVKENSTLNIKEITIEEFNKLFQAPQKNKDNK
jgi:trigger factor